MPYPVAQDGHSVEGCGVLYVTARAGLFVAPGSETEPLCGTL
jgi:hypothetical protein